MLFCILRTAVSPVDTFRQITTGSENASGGNGNEAHFVNVVVADVVVWEDVVVVSTRVQVDVSTMVVDDTVVDVAVVVCSGSVVVVVGVSVVVVVGIVVVVVGIVVAVVGTNHRNPFTDYRITLRSLL